ncbi:nuclear factor Y, subunit C10 [Tasmannia lanceolata]|uniref:nuclear factor Y, subunit C10 n=1 Tax=Tasmannia lanceolata TaxID=3420 RepID=UPI004063B327
MLQRQAEVVVVVTSSSSEEGEGDEAKSSDCILSTNNTEIKAAKGSVGSSCCCFPMSRVKRLMRSEGGDFRTTQDAVFLVNKAAEMFLQLFANDAYTSVASTSARVQSVTYQHLSSVVSNGKRYEFLSDFVPEKLRAEDALSDKALAGA